MDAILWQESLCHCTGRELTVLAGLPKFARVHSIHPLGTEEHHRGACTGHVLEYTQSTASAQKSIMVAPA